MPGILVSSALCSEALGVGPAQPSHVVTPPAPPAMQGRGTAQPEAPGPEPVSFLPTEGGHEQPQEPGKCDAVALGCLRPECGSRGVGAVDTAQTSAARPQGQRRCLGVRGLRARGSGRARVCGAGGGVVAAY